MCIRDRKAGFDFKSVTISGFQRKPSWTNLKKNVKTTIHLFTSTAEAKRIIQEFHPDICIGTGGYVSGPVIREAMKLGIPSLIQDVYKRQIRCVFSPLSLCLR